MSLEGKRAVVTAAAGGIGRAIALRLAEAGAHLSVCDLDEEGLELLAQEVRSKDRRCLAVRCDVADPEDLRRFIEATRQELDGVDILVNNAGRGGPGSVSETSYEHWRSVMALNLDAAFILANAFLPGMQERKWGRVIQIASLGGKRPFPHTAAYSTSKTALLGLTRSMALDYAADGITSNAVCPSWTQTDMADRFARYLVETQGMSEEEAYRQMASSLPQQRILESDEVAALVTYLASDEARGINGDAISIDQGSALC